MHKKGDMSKACNYRPISLCSVACKLMESIINSHLLLHLESNNLLSANQFGFRKNKSCPLQLLKCKNEWTKLLDVGESIDIIYIDFCKAFDSVSHPKLLSKLEPFGLDNRTCCWIKSILTGRSQQVTINTALS